MLTLTPRCVCDVCGADCYPQEPTKYAATATAYLQPSRGWLAFGHELCHDCMASARRAFDDWLVQRRSEANQNQARLDAALQGLGGAH